MKKIDDRLFKYPFRSFLNHNKAYPHCPIIKPLRQPEDVTAACESPKLRLILREHPDGRVQCWNDCLKSNDAAITREMVG